MASSHLVAMGRFCSWAAALVFLTASPEPALAYIDPNAGGPIFQVLFPLLALIASSFAVCRARVKQLLARLFGRAKHDGDPED